MPGGDGTGPAGFGSMTGRAAGFCAGYATPGYANPVGAGRGRGWGRGMGRGRGFGRGFGFRANAAAGFAQIPTAQQEVDSLRQQAEFLQESLSQINQRIEQLNKESNK